MFFNWRTITMGAFLASLFVFTACEIDPIEDPNNPSLESVTSDASKAELQTLVTGLEARHRGYYENATEMFGSFGREVYAYFGSDPRFLNDWLGLNITETYPDFFASGGTYISPYRAVNQANVLIQAAENSTLLTPEETNGYTGFAKTVKAFQLLWPWHQQGENGIRVDVEDPQNPGPTLSASDALSEIRSLLDEGLTELEGARNNITFNLSTGFTGVDLEQFNRAVAARAALYAEDWSGALTALSDSYMDLTITDTDGLNIGPSHVYGNAPDINNPLFYPFDRSTATLLVVHPAVIEDALPGDGRLAKFALRSEDNFMTDSDIVDPDGNLIQGQYQDARWGFGPTSNIASIPYLRNEELILIYAEANARLGNTGDAVGAINIVRGLWGVGDYSGATDTESLIDEILFQRRYSLWAEAGHRWIDLRRTGRLTSQFVDLREGGNLFMNVECRISEVAWDGGGSNCN